MSPVWKPRRKVPLRVEDIMSKPPISIPVTATADDAVKVMWENHIGSALIVDEEGKLVGIVTQRDVLYTGYRGLCGKGIPVRDIMTENPITVKPDEPLEEAIRKMKDADVSHLPVVDEEGKPVGVLSMRDVMDASMLLLRVLLGD
ncbi:MAG: histidine kinase [Thermoproteota archaeon]|nr:MAG: histidine kinase [Candidatus Korarchaeota archaeon]